MQKLIIQHSSEEGTKKVKPKKSNAKESRRFCISWGKESSKKVRNCKMFMLSPELKAIIGKDKETRSNVLKGVWKYIRDNNLQDPNNKKTVINDEAMKKVFQSDTITFSDIIVSVRIRCEE